MSGAGGHRGGRGRGEYYKQKYGGGGRGRGGGRGSSGGSRHDGDGEAYNRRPGGGNSGDLAQCLRRIDGKGYGAYKDVIGCWEFEGFSLIVDHAQADPFAAPSRCRVQVPHTRAGFPESMWNTKARRIALVDFVSRRLGYVLSAAGADIRTQTGGWGGEKGGEMTVDVPGQNVLERTSVLMNHDNVEARFTVALPAQGRSVLGQWATQILITNLPRYVNEALLFKALDRDALQRHISTVEDTEVLRGLLPGLGLVAFVGDGAILPRQSGASDLPMDPRHAVPFETPLSMAVEVELPNRGRVRGMGVPKGVTLFVGGGFHGKSTILKAIEGGVYNKVPGDGRELVATDPGAVKIRAEDGRSVVGVDISPFISNLPYGKDTRSFSTPDASGSTSQAANIQEALELGASVLLVDEDTCATNFMIRDVRMQALVAKDKEPITPFIAKVRPLVDRGVSCILVIGGSGDYFDVADVVVCMESFKAKDVTSAAKQICQEFPSANSPGGGMASAEGSAQYGNIPHRSVKLLHPSKGQGVKAVARTKAMVQFGEEEIDLSAVEQIVEKSQTRAIGDGILTLCRTISAKGGNGGLSLRELIQEMESKFDAQGLDVLNPQMRFGNYARPRRFEIAAAVNRLRSANILTASADSSKRKL